MENGHGPYSALFSINFVSILFYFVNVIVAGSGDVWNENRTGAQVEFVSLSGGTFYSDYGTINSKLQNDKYWAPFPESIVS